MHTTAHAGCAVKRYAMGVQFQGYTPPFTPIILPLLRVAVAKGLSYEETSSVHIARGGNARVYVKANAVRRSQLKG